MMAAGLFCALYGRLLLAPEGYLPSTMFHDFFSLFYPAAEVFRGLVHDGEWPLWNPYAFCGMPFLASIQMGLLYPPNWLHLILPTSRAFNILLVGHILFAGFGAWLYCRNQGRSAMASLFSAVAYAVSGRVLLHQFAGHPQIVYSAAWLPFLFWLVDRCLRRPDLRKCCALAFALALHFLCGWPMFSYLMAWLIPAYVLVQHRASPANQGTAVSAMCDNISAQNDLGTSSTTVFDVHWTYGRLATFFGGSALIALGIAAVQLLPTLEYMQSSHRGQGLDYEWSTTSSFPPTNLVTFLVPGFFGDHITFEYWGETSLWESTAYCGVATLLLAMIASLSRFDRTTAFWMFSGLLVMGVAMGKYSWLYTAGFEYVPGVSLFRGVGKLSVFVTLALAILAGHGFDIAFTGRRTLSRAARLFCAAALISALLGIAWTTVESGVNAPAPEWWHSFFDKVRGPNAFTLLQISGHQKPEFLTQSYEFLLTKARTTSVVLLVATLAVMYRSRLRDTGAILVTAVLCVDLYLFASPYMKLSDTAPLREPAKKIRQAIQDDSPWRFCCVSSSDTLINQFATEKLACPGGIEASLPTRYVQLFEKLTGADPQHITYLTMPIVHETLFDLLNVKYYAAAAQAPQVGDSSSDRIVAKNVFASDGLSFNLYENVDALPRAFIVHQATEVDFHEAGPILLPRLLLDGAESASFVEGRLPFPLNTVSGEQADQESCKIIRSGPSSMTLDATLTKPGIVLINENYDPGWRATIDGIAVDMLPANLCMRAIPVAAGTHTISIRYEPSTFYIGGRISIVVLCVMVTLCTWTSRHPADRQKWLTPRATAVPSKRSIRTRVVSSIDASAAIACAVGSIALGLLIGGLLYSMLVDVVPPGHPPTWNRSSSLFLIITLVAVATSALWMYRRKVRRTIFVSVTLATVLLPLLFAAEGVSRLFVPAWPARSLHSVAPDVARESWAHEAASSAGATAINDWGQRDRHRSITPATGTQRIAFIGDSFLEESNATPISLRVEDTLHSKFASDSVRGKADASPAHVEVLNLGVSASSPDEYYYRIRNVALPLGVDHCVMFLFSGNDFVESKQSLVSYSGIAAVAPRGSLLSSLGLAGVNHLLTSRQRPILEAWLGSQDLRREEELRFLAISESDDDQIRRLLLRTAAPTAQQMATLQSRLSSDAMSGFFEMCRNPDAGRFRSYYLSQGLWSASVGDGQWDQNSEEDALFWVLRSADLCRQQGVNFTLVIIPEGFSVDSRLVEQWKPLADMRHLTQPCRTAAERLQRRATAANIEVLDLHPHFMDVPGTYLNMDGHWSESGVALAAEVVSEKLLELISK